MFTLLMILRAWGADATHYGFFEVALEPHVSAQQCNSFAASGRNGECMTTAQVDEYLRAHECGPLSPAHYRCTRD